MDKYGLNSLEVVNVYQLYYAGYDINTIADKYNVKVLQIRSIIQHPDDKEYSETMKDIIDMYRKAFEASVEWSFYHQYMTIVDIAKLTGKSTTYIDKLINRTMIKR